MTNWPSLKVLNSSGQQLLAAVAALLAFSLLLLLPAPSQPRGLALASISLVARANVAVGAGMLLAMVRQRERKRSWRLVTVGLGLWVVADILHLAGWAAGPGSPPMPFSSDWVRIAGSAAYTTALLLYPVQGQGGFGRIRNILEVALVTLAALALMWLVLIRPMVQVGIPDMVASVWSVSILAMDFAAVALTFRLATVGQPGGERNLFLGIAAGFLLVVAADIAETLRVLDSGLRSAGLAETGWTLGSGLISFSIAHVLESEGIVERRGEWPSRGSMGSRLAHLLPLISTYLVVGFIIVDWSMTGRADLVGVTAAGALSLLLVARQGVLAGQAEMRQHAALVEAAADLAFVCQVDGKVLLTNPALRRAVGLAAAEESDLVLGELVGQARSEEILGSAAADGWSGEIEFRRLDGSDPLPVALSLRPLVDERRDEPLLAATGHDLTELRLREQDLRQALSEVAEAREQLEELNVSLEAKVETRTEELAQSVRQLERLNEELKELDRLKSEFVTLVSHELRAPLSNIRTGVELALKKRDEIPESIEDTLARVSSETERLVSFVEIILDLSALEAGRFPMASEAVPVGPVAAAVVNRIPPGAGSHRIDLGIPPDLPPVQADEQSLMSVLFHLVDNALKYAQAGPITISAKTEGSQVRVSVADNGPGIPEAERESVFEGFHRLDASDSREVYGHGLGLHLSQRLLQAMEGRIAVEQSDAGGAEVAFWLPIAQAAGSG